MAAISIEDILGEIANTEAPVSPETTNPVGIPGKITSVQLLSRVKVTNVQYWAPESRRFFRENLDMYLKRVGLNSPGSGFDYIEREAREGELEIHITHTQKSAATIRKIVDALVQKVSTNSKVYLQKFCKTILDFENESVPVGTGGLFGYFYIADPDYVKNDKVKCTHKYMLPRMPIGYYPARLSYEASVGRQFVSKLIPSSRGGDTVEPGYNKNFTLVVYDVQGFTASEADPEKTVPIVDLHIVKVAEKGGRQTVDRYNTIMYDHVDNCIYKIVGEQAAERIRETTTLTADFDLIYNIINELSEIDEGRLTAKEAQYIVPPLNGFVIKQSKPTKEKIVEEEVITTSAKKTSKKTKVEVVEEEAASDDIDVVQDDDDDITSDDIVVEEEVASDKEEDIVLD
jgi:hypothetical protein